MAAEAVSAKELKRRDFILHGNLWKVIITITFPLFLYTFINGFSAILDNFMCAKISATAVNSSVIITQIINMISAVGTGVSAGGSIMIAREIGKNNYQQARRVSSAVFTTVFVLGLLILLVFIPFAHPILAFSGLTEEEISIGLNYFIIQICTVCLQMINSVYMGVEKARGSTKGITLLNIGVLAIKASLSAAFIYGMQVQDMTWVGLATLIANASLTLFILLRLALKSYIFSFSFKGADFSPLTSKKLTALSFPIFLGKFIFSLGKWVILKMAADFYGNPDNSSFYQPLAKGALGISNNMGGLVTSALSSVEDSESAIISTNIGAGQEERALKTFFCSVTLELIFSVVGVGLISIPAVNDGIVWLFATTTKGGYSPEYASMISDIFFFEKMGIIALALNSAVLGLLYGFGYTRFSMILNFARVFVFRIPSLLVCYYGLKMDYKALGIAMGFSNIAIGIVAVLTGVIMVYKIRKRIREKEEAKMLTAEEKEKAESFIRAYLSSFTHYKASSSWDYEDGVVMKGAWDMYYATKDKFYLDFLISHYEACIQPDGSIPGYDPQEKNLDNIQEATALFNLEQVHHEERFQKALSLVASQLGLQPRTACGSFWHKERYPYQIWLDGLYMGLPFCALLSEENHSLKMRRDILKQFLNADKFNWDPYKRSYLHCYDEKKEMQWADKLTGRSPNVWLRSVGWLIMADCDVYDTFRKHSSYLAARRLKPQLQKALSSLKPYQDPETHLYFDLPLLGEIPGNYLETSGSLMVAYGYLKGARMGMISHSGLAQGSLILKSVIDSYLKDGHLQNICKVSGLDNAKRDGSVGYYLSEPVCADDPKGVGPFIMAYANYIRSTK
jgi:rhamnogalacturonyl hydrolase YesR/Na+-driven multidrug efflux pump